MMAGMQHSTGSSAGGGGADENSVCVRLVLGLGAAVALALAMSRDWGFYSVTAFGWLMAAWVLAVASCSLSERRVGWPGALRGGTLLVGLLGAGRLALTMSLVAGDRPLVTVEQMVHGGVWAIVLLGLATVALRLVVLGPPAPLISLTGSAALFLSAEAIGLTGPFYLTRLSDLLLLECAACVGFLAVVGLLLWTRPANWLVASAFGALLMAGLGVRSMAILAVPRPGIDVHAALQQAPVHLLHGRNPYTAGYQHPPNWAPEPYDAYPFYPPLPILVSLPLRAVGIDMRWGNVACDLVAAMLLFLVGRSRGQPVAAALLAGIYLNLPRAPFMIEQAWYEPMLASCLGAGFILWERGSRIGYFLLGLALLGKQYGVILFWPILGAMWRQWRALLGGLLLATLPVLPFVAWNARAFVDVVVRKHLERPMRDNALTVQAAVLAARGTPLPQWLLWSATLPVLAWISWRARCWRGVGLALCTGTALLTFCVFHTQAFFNYFYLCQYLFLLGLAGLMGTPLGRVAGLGSGRRET